VKNMNNTITLPTAVIALILGGCASQTAQIGSFHNNGDQAPLVYSSQLLVHDFKNLSDGEAVAIATGSDKAIARPNLTEIHVYKTIKSSSSMSAESDNNLKHCDPDGDGILDLFCPAKQQINDAGNSKYFDFTVIKFVRDIDGNWLQTINMDRDRISGNIYAGQYRMILLNTGTKDYSGPLIAYDKLEPAMTYTGIRSVSKVVDRRNLRANLSVIPYVGFVALIMDDFATTSGQVELKDKVNEGIVSFESKPIVLSPGEGIQIDFGINLALP
jgi:hypothetical protein